ncbi:hypothetical protein LJ739_01860 [Aestuariibacter halophilus]|uniref:Flagellar assembly factor FliW n=1 Tax=Fluctibacter halophilus TaxID=226011 RepID=A0ABS8G534_9ALTE|nr:hypothetical protein [Aestuariibacter halophilus]MCC2614985.1 hypothetical protein [Aestuariibacter halophilus]
MTTLSKSDRQLTEHVFYFDVVPHPHDAWAFRYKGTSPDAGMESDDPFPFDIDFDHFQTAQLVFNLSSKAFVYAFNATMLDKIRAPVTYNVHINNARNQLTVTLNLLHASEHYQAFNFQLVCTDATPSESGYTQYYSQDPKIGIKGNQG